MKKFLQLFALLIPALAFGQTAVQKVGGGNNALSNGSIIVPSSVSITATGTGVIAATSIPSISINTTAPLTGGGALTGSLTLAIPVATGSVNGYLSSADWTTFNAKQPAGSYITALTGDVTAAGPGSAVATLTNVISASSVGSSTAIPVLTYDAKGRLTSTTTAVVIAPAGTLTGATLAANVLASSLTSVGTLTGGATGAGFTLALGSSTISGVLLGANGGTGIANTGKTITLGGNWTSGGAVTWSGGFTFTGTLTGTTGVTFPTSGTLATTAGTVASITGTGNVLANGVTSAQTGAVTLTLGTALTSINSITATSATDFTAQAGSSGASITLSQGTNGNAAINPTGTGSTQLSASGRRVQIGHTTVDNYGGDLDVRYPFATRAANVPAQFFIADSGGSQVADAGGAMDFGAYSAVLSRAYSFARIIGAPANSSDSQGYLKVSVANSANGFYTAATFNGPSIATGNFNVGYTTPATSTTTGALLASSAGISGAIYSASLFTNATSGAFHTLTGTGSGDVYTQWQNSTPVQAGAGVTTGRVFLGAISNHPVDIRVNNGAQLTVSATSTTVVGNLTVSGTGTSTFAGIVDIANSGGQAAILHAPTGTGASAVVYLRWTHDGDGAWWASGMDSTTAGGNKYIISRASDLSNPLLSMGTSSSTGSLTVGYTTPGTSTTAAAVLMTSLGVSGATYSATLSLSGNATVGGTLFQTGDILLTRTSGNPVVNITNGSAGSFPLYQLTDVRTNGHQWNIENGRTLGSLTLKDANGAGVVATLGGTLAAGSVNVAYTTEATTGGVGSLTTAGGIYAAKKIITASTLTTAAGVTYDFGADVTGVTTTFVTTEYLTVIVNGSTKKIALVTSVP